MTQYNRTSRNPETAAIYATARWKALAKRVKREQPWCNTPGCTNLTSQADHIVPLVVILAEGGNPYERAGLQGLCLPCHGLKTRTEQGAARP